MVVRRTAVVKLDVSDDQRDALHRTAEQYLHCANQTVAFCWNDDSFTKCKTNKRQVRDALYADLREETELQAQLVQAAIKRAVEAVKACVERWKKGQRVSRPTFTSETMDYDARSATFFRRQVSLATVDGRVEPAFVLPSDSPTPYERYVLSEDYEFCESTLRYARQRRHRLRSSPTSGSGDAPVDVRVNGGMLNGDGFQRIAGA